MTIPIDALLTTALGAAFYSASRDHLAVTGAEPIGEADGTPSSASLLATPYYRWGMAYNTVVGMGIAVTAYVLNPDWMWMYWVDSSRIPFLLILYVFLMYPAMFTFGFLLADQTEKLRDRGGTMLLTGLLAGLLAFIVLTFGRIWNVGTMAQWDSEGCTPLIGSGFATMPLTWVLLVGLVLAVVSLIWILKKFAKGLS